MLIAGAPAGRWVASGPLFAALGFPIPRMDTFNWRGCRGREHSDQRRRVKRAGAGVYMPRPPPVTPVKTGVQHRAVLRGERAILTIDMVSWIPACAGMTPWRLVFFASRRTGWPRAFATRPCPRRRRLGRSQLKSLLKRFYRLWRSLLTPIQLFPGVLRSHHKPPG